MEFTRNEILVIAAAKGHFGCRDGDEIARKIIQYIIYGNPRRYFQTEITVLREIFRKSRDWTVKGWDDRIGEIYLKARDSNFLRTRKFIETELSVFENNLISLFLSELRHLCVSNDNGEEVINLDISEEEQKKVLAILDK